MCGSTGCWEKGGCQGPQKQATGVRPFFLGIPASCEMRFRNQGGKLGQILNLFLSGSRTLN